METERLLDFHQLQIWHDFAFAGLNNFLQTKARFSSTVSFNSNFTFSTIQLAPCHQNIPWAYKDVADVVAAVEGAGLSRKVVKLKPLGVIKG